MAASPPQVLVNYLTSACALSKRSLKTSQNRSELHITLTCPAGLSPRYCTVSPPWPRIGSSIQPGQLLRVQYSKDYCSITIHG